MMEIMNLPSEPWDLSEIDPSRPNVAIASYKHSSIMACLISTSTGRSHSGREKVARDGQGRVGGTTSPPCSVGPWKMRKSHGVIRRQIILQVRADGVASIPHPIPRPQGMWEPAWGALCGGQFMSRTFEKQAMCGNLHRPHKDPCARIRPHRGYRRCA